MPKIHRKLGRKCKGETLLYVFGFFFVLESICFILAPSHVYCQVNIDLVKKQVSVYTCVSHTSMFVWSEDSLEEKEVRFFSVCAWLNCNIL